MSNFKSASLVLKTADLMDPATKSGTLNGFFSSTTQLVICNFSNIVPTYGSISTSTNNPFKFYGATENSTGTATLTAATTATTSTTTISGTLAGGYLLQTPTVASVTGCSITGTTLTTGSAQTLTAGQYISGSGIIPGTTITVGGTSVTSFTISTSHTIASTTLNFFTPNTSVVANLGIFYSGCPFGFYILGNIIFNTSGNPMWQHSGSVLTQATSKVFTLYPLTQYNVNSLDPTASFQVGSCNNIRSVYTFNNINLRTLIGDMWDKYSSFNLCLEYIGTSYPILSSLTVNNDELAVNIKMSGFNFINSSYEIKNNCNTSNIVLAPFYFSNTLPINLYLSNASQYTFLKNNDIFNINIQYERILDGKSPNNTTVVTTTNVPNIPYPNMVFIFKIFGCDPIDTNNASRIKNI